MTTTTTITITRGLATIKQLDEKISTYFNQPKLLVALTNGNNNVGAGSTTAEAISKQIQADHNTIDELIRRRDRIKTAIVLKNATTVITLGTKSMTVAEAIVQKSLVPAKEALLTTYRQHWTKVVKALDDAEKEFDKRVQLMIQANLSADTVSEEYKRDVATRVTEEQRKLAGPRIYDPMNLKDKITSLENEISDLKTELDYVLSTSNTVETITIED